MKIVRFRNGEDIAYGLADADGVTLYHGTPFVAWEPTETVIGWETVELLAPVLPSKIVGVGGNYEEHNDEMHLSEPEEPILFIKPTTSVIGPGAPVIYPRDLTAEVHHEAGLAAVIGRLARNVPAEDASLYVFGYTAANDVTARDLQQRDGQWSRAKGFDTFCPLGPAIETELDPLERLAIIGRVDDELRQTGFTSDMIFGVAELVEFISSVMTLLPGDVILTGTPAGVGPVAPGQTMDVEIDGIGLLHNPVVAR